MSIQFLCEWGYIPGMLSKSRLNRRLHRLVDLFVALFLRPGEYWKSLDERSSYVLDSYPIAVCDNYRIPNSKIYPGEDWHGYISSKKRYFYGVRIYILITETGEPVEFFLAPGALCDTSALSLYQMDLPEGAWVTGDKAYNEYTVEDILRETGIELLPMGTKNSLRLVPPFFMYIQASVRKIVETTGCLIERFLPKSNHAVTAKGFELKVALFVLACSINFLW